MYTAAFGSSITRMLISYILLKTKTSLDLFLGYSCCDEYIMMHKNFSNQNFQLTFLGPHLFVFGEMTVLRKI